MNLGDFINLLLGRFNFSYARKTSCFIIDTRTIKEGESKVEKVWSWKRLKSETFVITREGGKIKIKKIRC